MSLVKRAVLPAVVAAALVAASTSIAAASGGASPSEGGPTTVAQESDAHRELTAERSCARVARSPRAHPVLTVLCRLYVNPSLPADARREIGNAIVSIVEHRLDRRDGQPRPPRVRPAATATPAN